MPYAPGVTDISGQIRAQYMMQGRNALGQGLASMAEGFAKQKDEYEALQSKIKGFETVIKNDPQSFGLDEEKVDMLLAGNPNETAKQKAQRIQSFVETALTQKTLKNAEAQRQQMEAENQLRKAQMDQIRAKAEQDKIDRAFLSEGAKLFGLAPGEQAAATTQPPAGVSTSGAASVVAPPSAGSFLGGGGNSSVGIPEGVEVVATKEPEAQSTAAKMSQAQKVQQFLGAAVGRVSPEALQHFAGTAKLLMAEEKPPVTFGKTPGGAEFVVAPGGAVHFTPKPTEVEKPPQGYRWTDPDKTKLEPIPGSAAALEQDKMRIDIKAKEEKEKAEAEAIKNRSDKAREDIDRTVKNIDEAIRLSKSGAGGVLDTAYGKVTQTGDTRRLDSVLKSIKSQLGLSNLMEMKSLSSTGASGFGSLSGPELELLQTNIAELSPWVGEDITQENLVKVKEALLKIRGANKTQPAKDIAEAIRFQDGRTEKRLAEFK